jgi:SAM-dependent methyltransferase
MSGPRPGHQGSGERTTGGIVGFRGRWGMRDWGIGRASTWNAAGVTDTDRMRRERNLGAVFARAGLDYAGVDLAPASVAACRADGLDVRLASAVDLPFADAAFDAGWTMSTLLHVADADPDTAMAEIVRVLRPGAPLAVGLWGGRDLEEDGPRYFSFRSDEKVRAALARHAAIESWDTWEGTSDLHYQFAVLRTP